MGDFLAAIGALCFLAALVMLVVRVVFKKGMGYKKIGFLAVASVLSFCVGAVIASSSPEYQKSREINKASDWVETTTERGSEITGLKTSKAKSNNDTKESGGAIKETGDKAKPKNDKRPNKVNSTETKIPSAEEKVTVEGAGQRIMELTDGILKFTIVENIEVYQQGDKTWAEVETGEVKDYDDGGWCEDIAKLTILNAFTGDVIYLDEARVYNADGLQVASMRNWLPKE